MGASESLGIFGAMHCHFCFAEGTGP